MKAIDEVLFAQAVQLAAGFLAAGNRETIAGEAMRCTVMEAYRALQEARQGLQDPAGQDLEP